MKTMGKSLSDMFISSALTELSISRSLPFSLDGGTSGTFVSRETASGVFISTAEPNMLTSKPL